MGQNLLILRTVFYDKSEGRKKTFFFHKKVFFFAYFKKKKNPNGILSNITPRQRKLSPVDRWHGPRR